jgi:hypothetical protein
MIKSLTLKLSVAFIGAVVMGLAATTAWRYGILQTMVEQEQTQPDWTFVLGGVVGGVLCTIDYWVRPPCKYAAATMTASAAVLLAGFFWATKHFGFWEAAFSHVGDFGPTNAPWVVAGAGFVYMFYVAMVMLLFARSRR